MRLASHGAASWEIAPNRPEPKKKAPAADSDRPKRWNSHRASRELTTRPPAKESTENKAARRTTTALDGPSGAGLA